MTLIDADGDDQVAACELGQSCLKDSSIMANFMIVTTQLSVDMTHFGPPDVVLCQIQGKYDI